MKAQKEQTVENFREKLFIQRKKMLIAAGILFTLLMLLTGFYIYKIKMESDAKELEYEAYRYYTGRVKNSELTMQQRMTKAAQLFTDAYGKRKNITYLLNAAYAYERAGEKEKSIEILNRVATSSDPNFSNLARVKIAMIHIKNNKNDMAVKELDEILKDKNTTMQDFALYQLGKLYERENRQEALKYYKLLVEKFPGSEFSKLVKPLLENKNP